MVNISNPIKRHQECGRRRPQRQRGRGRPSNDDDGGEHHEDSDEDEGDDIDEAGDEDECGRAVGENGHGDDHNHDENCDDWNALPQLVAIAIDC